MTRSRDRPSRATAPDEVAINLHSEFRLASARLPLDVSGHVLGRATDDEAFGPVVVPRGEAVTAARQLRSNVGFL